MKKRILLLIAFAFCLMNSCDFGDMNVDPNNLSGTSVPMANRLPAIQLDLMNIHADRVVKRIANTTGQVIYRQGPTGLNEYNYTPGDASNIILWERLYTRAMNGAFQLANVAEEENAPHYQGIANILVANALGTATSIWGDIPFSEAFRPDQFTDPKFDNQAEIYQEIQALLDKAIALLNEPAGSKAPAADDLIFNGNAARWIKVAYGLKARYYLHLVKRNPQAYTLAETALQNALQSNADNCVLKYSSGTPDQVHPLFLERTATRDTEVDTAFANILLAEGDPRKDFFTKITGSIFFGIRANYGPFVSMPDSDFPLITFEECAFMLAEIRMKAGDKSGAAFALNNAIQASLERVCTRQIGNLDPQNDNLVAAIPLATLSAYATTKSNIAALNDADAWRTIFRQKQIAMFLQAETWNDYRRTENYVPGEFGLPRLPIRAGNSLPRRYPYSGNEINFNANAPTNPGIFERVWWDQN